MADDYTQNPGAMPEAPSATPGDIDPRVIRRIMQRYGLDEEQAAAMLRYRRAEALAGTAVPAGQAVGQTFVAPHPLGVAMSALAKGLGYRGMAGAEEEMRRLGRRRRGAAEAAAGLDDHLTNPDAVGDSDYADRDE